MAYERTIEEKFARAADLKARGWGKTAEQETAVINGAVDQLIGKVLAEGYDFPIVSEWAIVGQAGDGKTTRSVSIIDPPSGLSVAIQTSLGIGRLGTRLNSQVIHERDYTRGSIHKSGSSTADTPGEGSTMASTTFAPLTTLRCDEHDPDGKQLAACSHLMISSANTTIELLAAQAKKYPGGSDKLFTLIAWRGMKVALDIIPNGDLFQLLLATDDHERAQPIELGFFGKAGMVDELDLQIQFAVEDTIVDSEVACKSTSHWRYAQTEFLTQPSDVIAWIRSGLCRGCLSDVISAESKFESHGKGLQMPDKESPNTAKRGGDVLEQLKKAEGEPSASTPTPSPSKPDDGILTTEILTEIVTTPAEQRVYSSNPNGPDGPNGLGMVRLPDGRVVKFQASGTIEAEPIHHKPREHFSDYRARERAAGINVKDPINGADRIQYDPESGEDSISGEDPSLTAHRERRAAQYE